ncbi:MAG: heparinase II/III family protein [Victivallales bacterium]|nr:heparinase II/III family protein [Victivallales bacterium]
MKTTLLYSLLSLQILVAQELFFTRQPEDWQAKNNATVSTSAGTVRTEIDTTRFNFTWWRAAIPPCEYGRIQGFAGRVRLVSGCGGLFSTNIVMFREPIRYYHQTIMYLRQGDNGWHEFFLPITAFSPHGGTATPFSVKELMEGDNLQFILEKLRSTTVAELDSLHVVQDSAPPTELKRLRSLHITNRLREGTTNHPKILLKGDFLEKVRAKATAGGMEQTGYETLLKWANSYMENVDENEPLKAVLAFRNNEGVNFQKNRAAFEYLLRDASTPVEILAAAGLITGDESYSRKAATMLANMAKQLDVSSPELAFGFYYTRTLYVRALAMGYDWCHDFLTPEQRTTVKTTLLGFVLEIYNRSWLEHWGKHPLQRIWNWNPGLMSCAGLGLLALEGETTEPEAAMIFECRRHLRDYLTLGIDSDGACMEGPAYINYGIGCGIIFMEALRQQGRGDLFTDTNAHLIAPWLAFEMLPGRTSWNDLNDCNRALPSGGQFYHYALGRYAELAQSDPARKDEKWPASPATMTSLEYLRHFSEKPGERPLSYESLGRLLSWSWSAGPLYKNLALMDARLSLINTLFFKYMQPVDDPAELLPESQHFRGRGLVVSRIGFGPESLHLAVEAGPHAAGHDQADKGSFTLSAYGMDIFIDSGYGNDGQLLKSSSSHAHNMVLIDGQGQHLSPYHNNSGGAITGYSHSDDYDWIRVDASEAWNTEYINDLYPVPADGNVKRYERQFLLLRSSGDHPPCLVISDDICKNDTAKHTFSWLWHFGAHLKITDNGAQVTLGSNKEGLLVFTTLENKGDASATFSFTVPADGDYKLAGLTAARGASIGQSDSFFLDINGEELGTWDIAPTRNLAWSEVKGRGEAVPRKFTLKGQEKVVVRLRKREWGAVLAKMALVPYDVEIGATPEVASKNTVVLTIADAEQDKEKPFEVRRFGAEEASEVTATLFIVGTPEGHNSHDWYETSHNGSHQRFIHTVKDVENPHFLMVVVPRRDNSQPLPTVEKLAEKSLQIRWSDGHQNTITFDHLAMPTVQNAIP